MASSKPFYVDGMTVEDILNLGDDILSKLDERELSRALRTVSLAANKRVNRLLPNVKKTKDGYKLKKSAQYNIATDALNAITEDGKISPKFGVGTKNRNQMYAEFARVRKFMNLKTSTIKGAKQVMQEREKRMLGITYQDYLKKASKQLQKELGKKPTKKDLQKLRSKTSDLYRDKLSEAYSMFRKFNEMQGISNSPYKNYYGSTEVMSIIGQRTLSGDSDDDILNAADNVYNKAYEDQQDYIEDMLETDDPFELVGDDSGEWGIEI